MKKLAVIGGGLSGRLMAYHLSKAGFLVSLFDKGCRSGQGSAAYVAAAMLSPTAEAVDCTPQVYRLGLQSLVLWRELLSDLIMPVMHQEMGSLIVWHPQDRPLATEFYHHINRVTEHFNHPKNTNKTDTLQICHADDIAKLEPQLTGRFGEGYWLPKEGQLDGREVLLALADELERMGVCCHWQSTDVDKFILNDDIDGVIDCRGYGAAGDWQMPSGSVLRGVRGEVARIYAPEIKLQRPVRILHPRYPIYIAPKQNHVYVVGATQIESQSDAPVSVRSGLELLSALYAVHPSFGESSVLELNVGLRPALNHHNPEIRFDRKKNLVQINGLYRHGFMIAPAVIMAAVRLVQTMHSGNDIPKTDEISDIDYIDLNTLKTKEGCDER